MIKCDTCDRYFKSKRAVTSHKRFCNTGINLKGSNNPFYGRKFSEESLQKLSKSIKSKAKKILWVEVFHKCDRCNKWFETQIRIRDNALSHKCCSDKCSHARTHSEETRKKVSNTIKSGYVSGRIVNIHKIERIEVTCNSINCQKMFLKRIDSNKKYCCETCTRSSAEYLAKAREAGKKSANSQRLRRRSKNEIYFYELCCRKFKNVLHNEAIFNGWDADVIIEDIKTAILWNGIWHYKKVADKHSVEQVQSREKIKIKEIERAGYKVYIIKDMGKHNELFVEVEFDIFMKQLALA